MFASVCATYYWRICPRWCGYGKTIRITFKNKKCYVIRDIVIIYIVLKESLTFNLLMKYFLTLRPQHIGSLSSGWCGFSDHTAINNLASCTICYNTIWACYRKGTKVQTQLVQQLRLIIITSYFFNMVETMKKLSCQANYLTHIIFRAKLNGTITTREA